MIVNIDMKVYSEHYNQNIVNNNKTQYKQAHLTTILQSTMLFERAKFEVNGYYSESVGLTLFVILRISHLSGWKSII